MKHFIKSGLLIFTSIVCVFAQNPKSAEQQAEELRGQLRGVIDKEAELQIRLQQIEEDLKPENIQRSIALIGTTRPGDLREQRRSQLEKERAGVQAQLEQLVTSRTRLEASINTAETQANNERTRAATPPPPTPVNNRVETSPTPAVIQQQTTTKRPVKRSRRKRPRRRSS